MAVPIDKDEAKAKIAELVEAFRKNEKSFTSSKYNETQARTEFISPFLEALGWDVYNSKQLPLDLREVYEEATVEVGEERVALDLENNENEKPQQSIAWGVTVGAAKGGTVGLAATAKLNEAKQAATRRIEMNFKKIKSDLEDFQDGDQRSDYITLIQQENLYLPVPRNYSEAYDAAIDLAEWDVNDTLVLTYAEFQCFVRDEWDWTEEFVGNTCMYLR